MREGTVTETMPAWQDRTDVGAPAMLFTDAVKGSSHRLIRLAYLLTGDMAEAEDAVAEAYAKVWSRFRHGQVDDLSQYLQRAVVNTVRGNLRHRLVVRRQALRAGPQLAVRPFEDRVVDRDRLWAEMLTLPIRQRTALTLRFVEDLSEQETALVLGVKPGTVKSRVSRGLEQLRGQLNRSDQHE
jgi:RNA polymerase sigma-70 factor (sigma-E family)